MTTAEQLRAEGEARGEARGRAKALLGILALKFGPVPTEVTTMIHTADETQWREWIIRAATTAEILEDVILEERIPAERRRAAARSRQETRGHAHIQLYAQMVSKFGSLPIWVAEKLGAADMPQLQVWTDLMKTADSVDEIFRPQLYADDW